MTEKCHGEPIWASSPLFSLSSQHFFLLQIFFQQYPIPQIKKVQPIHPWMQSKCMWRWKIWSFTSLALNWPLLPPLVPHYSLSIFVNLPVNVDIWYCHHLPWTTQPLFFAPRNLPPYTNFPSEIQASFCELFSPLTDCHFFPWHLSPLSNVTQTS